MPIKFTSRGQIGLWRGSRKVSDHLSETAAVEAAIADAEVSGVGVYRLRYPDKDIDLSRLDIVVYPTDTTAPTVPAISSVVAVSSSRLDVTWSASTDAGSGLAGYRLYSATSSGGTYTLLQELSPASLSYSHTELSASTSRWYRVSAFDAEGNESAQSSAVSGTTEAEAPSETFETGLIIFDDFSTYTARPVVYSGAAENTQTRYLWSQGTGVQDGGDLGGGPANWSIDDGDSVTP